LTTLAQERRPSARRAVKRRRGTGRSPLLAPVMIFAAAVATAGIYVAYILWPRWPEAPVMLDAPSLPIVVSGTAFNVEPAAIRMRVQRRPGAHERVDLSYLWPSLVPPDPALKSTVGVPVDPNERLFVTIASGETTLPLMERVQSIYPRYLVPEPVAGPPASHFAPFVMTRHIRAKISFSIQIRRSIFWRVARARASSIRGSVWWKGVSAMPMLLCVFRANGWQIGRT
jgi:hypothetical protein